MTCPALHPPPDSTPATFVKWVTSLHDAKPACSHEPTLPGTVLTSCCESGNANHCRNNWSSFNFAQGYIGWFSSPAADLPVLEPARQAGKSNIVERSHQPHQHLNLHRHMCMMTRFQHSRQPLRTAFAIATESGVPPAATGSTVFT